MIRGLQKSASTSGYTENGLVKACQKLKRSSYRFSNELRWEPEYYMIETGTCPSGQIIMDTALCAAAATALSLSDTSVSTSSGSYGRPQGCVDASGYLYLYASGSSSCSSSSKCLCMPPYGPTPSPTPDPFPASSRFAVTYSVLFFFKDRTAVTYRES